MTWAAMTKHGVLLAVAACAFSASFALDVGLAAIANAVALLFSLRGLTLAAARQTELDRKHVASDAGWTRA